MPDRYEGRTHDYAAGNGRNVFEHMQRNPARYEG